MPDSPYNLILSYSHRACQAFIFLHLCGSFTSLIFKVFKKSCLNNLHFLSVQVGTSKTGFFKPSFVSWSVLCQCILDLFECIYWFMFSVLQVGHSYCTSSFAHSQRVHGEGLIFYFFSYLMWKFYLKRLWNGQIYLALIG